jgi:hypothetical protein
MIPVDWRARLAAEIGDMVADLDEPARVQARADVAAGRARLYQTWPDLVIVELEHDVLVTAWSALALQPHHN